MTFATRLSDAVQWEHMVAQWFNCHPGVLAEPFGQAMLSTGMRKQLRAYNPPVLLRWLPDLLVACPKGAILVDAKSSLPHVRTGNHAVEVKSTDAALAMQQTTGIKVFYAFRHNDDQPGFVAVNDWLNEATDGVYLGVGSGTPYKVAACGRICRRTTDPQLYDQEAEVAIS